MDGCNCEDLGGMRRVWLKILAFSLLTLLLGQDLKASFYERVFITPYLIIGNHYYQKHDYDSALLVYSISEIFLLKNTSSHLQEDSLLFPENLYYYKYFHWTNLRLGQINYFQGNFDNSEIYLEKLSN